MTILFLVTSIIYSLVSVYWTPAYHTNTLSLIYLKLHIFSKEVSHEYLWSCKWFDYHNLQFKVLTAHKITLTALKSIFSRRIWQNPPGPHCIIYPTIYSMSKVISSRLIDQCFDNYFHQVIQNMAKLVIYTILTNTITKLLHPSYYFLIA